MKKILIIICGLFGIAQAQTIGYLRYDSVKMAKTGGNTELILENATKAVTGGVLTNTGNGRTAFVLGGGVVVSDSAWSLTGNSGTTAGTNYIGTTDSVDLVIKTNGYENTRITPLGKVDIIDAAGKRMVNLDPTNLLWQFGDYNGDFGNATSIHIADSTGEVRIDGYLNVQQLIGESLGANEYDTYPVFYNDNSQDFEAGSGIDSIWRPSADSIRFRVRSSTVGKYGTFGIYAPTAGGGSQTFQQTLTTGSTLTGDNTVTNTGHTFKISNTTERLSLADSAWFIGNERAYVKSNNVGNKLHIYTPETTTDTSTYKILVGKSSDGESAYMSYWPVGGSGTVNSGTQYRLGYYATTGTAISEAAAITASRALISDANGVPTHATTTATQLGYLSAATGTTGTASTNLVYSASPTFTGTVAAGVVAMTENATITKSYTGATSLTISNTSATTSTEAKVGMVTNAGNSTFGAYSTATSFAMIGAGQMYLYNDYASGGIALVAAGASGTIRFGSGGTSEGMRLTSNRLYIGGGTSATAKVHIAASTTGASSGQIKLAEGSDLTTPEDGNINYVSNNLKFTEASTVYTLAKTLTNTATLDFGSTAAGAAADLTITVTGAAVGDAVYIGVDNASVSADNIGFWGWVSSSNTVTVRFNNNNLVSAVDPASGTFRAVVTKY